MGRASSYRGARPLTVSSPRFLGAVPLFLLSLFRVGRYHPGAGGYAQTVGVDTVFFDSLCARYARGRIVCAMRVAWWRVRIA